MNTHCETVHPSRYANSEQCEGPVDATGLPASKALRCERVVEQSDPETCYSGRQGRRAVSAHRYLMHSSTPDNVRGC